MRFPKKAALLCCLLIASAFSRALYAQIIYTDIPDATPNATCSLDLNNDSIDDFIIYYGAGVMCSPQHNNAYAGNLIGGVHAPWALSASASICDSLATWYGAATPGTMAEGTSTGYWVGETDKYLALKLIVGANTYYGWARFDVVATSSSFTLKDYAYESTPNACIEAGQIVLGIDGNTPQNRVSVFPNPFSSSAIIQTTGDFQHASLSICNSYGQTVKHVDALSGHSVSVSRNNLPGGLYFIWLTEGNKVIAVEKVVITD